MHSFPGQLRGLWIHCPSTDHYSPPFSKAPCSDAAALEHEITMQHHRPHLCLSACSLSLFILSAHPLFPSPLRLSTPCVAHMANTSQLTTQGTKFSLNSPPADIKDKESDSQEGQGHPRLSS